MVARQRWVSDYIGSSTTTHVEERISSGDRVLSTLRPHRTTAKQIWVTSHERPWVLVSLWRGPEAHILSSWLFNFFLRQTYNLAQNLILILFREFLLWKPLVQVVIVIVLLNHLDE